MGPTRQGLALVAGAVTVMLLAACTGGLGAPGNGETGPAVTPGHTSARPSGPSASSTAPAAESTLDCGDFINTRARTAPLRVVLGVVALPASPGYSALQTFRAGGTGPQRLIAKTGLVIKPGTSFELIVPARFTRTLDIGWGSPGTPSHRVRVSDCASAGGGWLGYAGGYWIDHPACVPIVVKAGGKQQQVHIGVGKACPGQRPPQGPSDGA